MAKDIVKEIIDSWQREFDFNNKEFADSFPLTIYLSKEDILKIDYLINRDNTFIDSFFIDSQYAYLVKNNLLDEPFTAYFDYKFAKQFIDNHPLRYACNINYYPLTIAVTIDEFEGLYFLYNNELKKDSTFTFDDLYHKFIIAYEESDIDELRKLFDEAYDEIEEDVKRN